MIIPSMRLIHLQVKGLIDKNRCAISRLPPELIFLIIRNIPYHTRPRLDLFTSVVSASRPRLASLDLAAIAAPLLCSSWSGPGTEVLYEHITLYTGAQCVLLHRTLQDAPSLRPLIRFLCLPSPREVPVVTPPTVIQLSADIMAACTHVQGIHVLQEASDIPFQTNYRN